MSEFSLGAMQMELVITKRVNEDLHRTLARREKRIRELEDKVERLEAGDPQTHMHIGDALDYWAKEQWHYIVCDADGWRTTEYIGKTAAEALAKIRKAEKL